MSPSTKKDHPREQRKADRKAAAAAAKAAGANPRWYVPLMVGLMVVGLVWVVVYYLTQARFPVQSWGNWNLGAGFGLIILGFLMTTRWR